MSCWRVERGGQLRVRVAGRDGRGRRVRRGKGQRQVAELGQQFLQPQGRERASAEGERGGLGEQARIGLGVRRRARRCQASGLDAGAAAGDGQRHVRVLRVAELRLERRGVAGDSPAPVDLRGQRGQRGGRSGSSLKVILIGAAPSASFEPPDGVTDRTCSGAVGLGVVTGLAEWLTTGWLLAAEDTDSCRFPGEAAANTPPATTTATAAPAVPMIPR